MELKEIRTVLNMTKEDAASAMGVSVRTVDNIEKGEKISRSTREKLEKLEKKAQRKLAH